MKQKDIALVIIVAIFSIIVATLISNFVFGSSEARQAKAEVVEAISPTFTQPDDRYFNQNSVDPTQVIRIGEDSNQTPFKQTL